MDRSSLALVSMVVGLGCRAEDREPSEGIFVGNPPGLVGVVGASGDRGVAEVTEFVLARSTLFDCAGDAEALTLREDDPLGLAELPMGGWCALELEPDGPVVLEGEFSEVTFALSIPVERIFVEGRLDISEGDGERRFVLELGEESDFADRLAFSDPGTHIELDVAECLEAELCQEIVSAVEDGSALFEDIDMDGVISERERYSFEVMRGEARAD